jgi:hypothetical protein
MNQPDSRERRIWHINSVTLSHKYAKQYTFSSQCCESVQKSLHISFESGSYLDIFVAINNFFLLNTYLYRSELLNTIKYRTFSNISFNHCRIVRIRIYNNRTTDPDPGGQLITDTMDPVPKH